MFCSAVGCPQISGCVNVGVWYSPQIQEIKDVSEEDSWYLYLSVTTNFVLGCRWRSVEIIYSLFFWGLWSFHVFLERRNVLHKVGKFWIFKACLLLARSHGVLRAFYDVFSLMVLRVFSVKQLVLMAPFVPCRDIWTLYYLSNSFVERIILSTPGAIDNYSRGMCKAFWQGSVSREEQGKKYCFK